MLKPGERRILVVAGFAPSLVNFRLAVLQALRDDGWEVHACAPEDDPAVAERLARLGIRLHRVALARAGLNPLADLSYMLRLAALMRRLAPQVVLSYTMKPNVYAGLACRLARVPRFVPLVTGLGYAFLGEGRGRRLLNAVVVAQLRLSLRRARLVFFQNDDDRALFAALRIVGPAHRACVVPGSGVDIAHFAPAPLPAAAGFLMIGRLLVDKGVREYAQAAAQVRRLRPDAVFELAGWLDDNPASITQAELDAWCAAGTLRFLGRLDDVRPALARCRVFVLPSYREGMPRTVLEAMAVGRAVIATDVPGCREAVRDGDNGLLVPARDPKALADAMIRLLDDPALAERMARRGREMAMETYDARRVGRTMVDEIRHDAQAPV